MSRTRMVDELRKMYPIGTRVRLIYMDDIHAIPEGTEGMVKLVDDIGTIHVDWDNGRALGVIPGVDRIEVIDTP